MSQIGATLRNALKAILRGELLLHLNVGKYFVHIIYTFFVFALIIWVSLKIEGTMAQVEQNKKTIRELEILNAEKNFQVVSLSRRSNVEERLRQMGSTVTEASKPATIIKK